MNARIVFSLFIALASALWFAAPAAAKGTVPKGTITISYGPDLLTMDPHALSDFTCSALHPYLFDLLLMRRKGDYKLEGSVAESYRWLDPKLLEIVVRKGMKFSNGEDVDAEAVRFTFQRMTDPKYKSAFTQYFRTVERVDVVDKYTARFVMKAPDPDLIKRMGLYYFVVPPKYYSSQSLSHVASNPVGSGPYLLKKWVRGEYFELEANPNYWKENLPTIKTVIIRAIPDINARVMALLKGEVDIIRAVPPHLVQKLVDSPRVDVKAVRGLRLLRVAMLTTKPGPLANPTVRRAISHAIDVDSIIKTVAGGAGARTAMMLHPWSSGYDPTIKPYKHDLALAQKLMKEAGYPNGFETEFWSPSGRYPNDKQISEMIVFQLQKIGIKAELKVVEWGLYTKHFAARKKPETKPFMMLHAFGNSGMSAQAAWTAMAHSRGFWSAFADPKVDAMLDEAGRIVDEKEAQKKYSALGRYLQEVAADFPLYQIDDVHGVNKRLIWEPRHDEKVWVWDAKIKGLHN